MTERKYYNERCRSITKCRSLHRSNRESDEPDRMIGRMGQVPLCSRSLMIVMCFMAFIQSPVFAGKVYVVSPLGQFPPQTSATASWITSTDLAKTLQGLTKDDTVYLCEGEEFFTNSGPFAINSGQKISTYPCNPSLLCALDPQCPYSGIRRIEIRFVRGQVVDPQTI